MNKKVLFLLILMLCGIFLTQIPFVSATPVYEDFTDGWIEKDDNNHIDFTAHHIDFACYRDEDAWLYKDRGVDHFGDFEHLVDVKPVEIAVSDCGIVWCLSNDIDDLMGLRTGGKTAVALLFYAVTVEYLTEVRLYLEEEYGGSPYNDYSVVTEGTQYYLTINKVGTTIFCEIYTDSSRENLHDNITRTLHGDHKFRYIFACNTLNTGTAKDGDIDIDNLFLRKKVSITFRFNDGGEFRVDCTTVINGSENEYWNNTVLALSALPQNSSIVFVSFNWTGGSSTTNPYNLTITGNWTIWCYFDSTPEGEPYITSRFCFSPSNPLISETVSFNGSYSSSSSTINIYSWTFGDGDSDSGSTTTHAYNSTGNFAVTLSVTSDAGTDSFVQTLTVSEETTTETTTDGSAGGYMLLIYTKCNDLPCSANVTIQNLESNFSHTQKCDLMGNTRFTLPYGTYLISAEYMNRTKQQEIKLRDNTALSFDFKIKGAFIPELGLIVIGVIVILGIFWMYPDLFPKKVREKPRKHKKREKPRKHKDNLKPRKHRR